MRSRQIALFIFGGLASLAVMAGAAWACSATLSLDPTNPVAPDSGRAGATVTVTATGGEGATEVQLLWDHVDDHRVLATVAPGSISASVTVPSDASPGLHLIQVQGIDRNVIGPDGNPKVLGRVQAEVTVEAGPPVVSTDPTPDPATGPPSSTPGPTGGDTGDAPTAVAPTPDPAPNPTPNPGTTAGPVDPVPSGSTFVPVGRGTGVVVRPPNGGRAGIPAGVTPSGTGALAALANRSGDQVVAGAPTGGPTGPGDANGTASSSDVTTAGGFTVGGTGPGSAPVVAMPGSPSERTFPGNLWRGFVSDNGQARHRAGPSLDGAASSLTDHGAMGIGIGLLFIGLMALLAGGALVRTRSRRAVATTSRPR